MRRAALIALCLLAIAPSAAVGCERTPDLARLPNETDDQFEKRLSRIEHEQDVVRNYQQEEHVVKHSPVIYVARVVETSRTEEMPATLWAVLQPIKSIRGEMPASARRLTKQFRGCSTLGDGDAAHSELGSIFFVFEGLPKAEGRPNGIDSLSAGSVLTYELINGLWGYETKQP